MSPADTLPGAASIPAPDSRHAQMAANTGRRVVDMVWEDLCPRDIVDARAIDNALTTVLALGGSTNAIVHLIAIARRAGVPLDLAHFEPPEWFLTVRRQNKIEASHRHTLYAAIAGLLLDLLDALQGNPAAVAINLGISTTAVIKFLESDPHLWTAANEIRLQANMKPLTHRR